MEQLNLKCTLNQNGSITASWNRITQAVRYHAYMRIEGESQAIYNQENLTATSYTSPAGLKDNRKYQVTVVAYSSSTQLVSEAATLLIPFGLL